MGVSLSVSRGRESPKWWVCIRNHHILFFLSFLPHPYLKKKIYEMKSLVRRSEEEGTAWIAKNLDLTLAFSPSLFLHVFEPTLRLSSMGTQPGPYWENKLFRPSTSWLELRGGPHIWNDVIPSALIPWLSSWHWQTAWGTTFDPFSSWFNLTGMFQLLNLYLSK